MSRGSDRIAGVYAILCNATGHVYIGGTADMPQRYHHHFARLRLGKHTNRSLQFLFDAHGEGALSWVTLELLGVQPHADYPDSIDLAAIGRVESRWVAEIKTEVGPLVINDADFPLKGLVSLYLPEVRRKRLLLWPPFEFGGPPHGGSRRCPHCHLLIPTTRGRSNSTAPVR